MSETVGIGKCRIVTSLSIKSAGAKYSTKRSHKRICADKVQVQQRSRSTGEGRKFQSLIRKLTFQKTIVSCTSHNGAGNAIRFAFEYSYSCSLRTVSIHQRYCPIA